jgi:SlyX protein
MSEPRLNDIELKLMEQEHALNDLSDVVNKQWQEIEKLKRQLSRAGDRIDTLEEALPDGAPVEKPPHY